MNILLAADYGAPKSGNFIASCVELGRRLKSKKHKISFIFPENANTLSEDSWTAWLGREGFAVYLYNGEKEEFTYLKEIIGKEDADILHLHFGMFQAAAAKRAKELGVRLLIHDHMDFPAGSSRARQRAVCAAKSLIYRIKGISVIAVNPLKAGAYPFARHWYIPNGLSMIRNVSRSLTGEECRRELGIAPDAKVCMFLGWDLYRKGLDIAVRAIEEINRTDSEMLLCIVGLGCPPDPERTKYITDRTGIAADSPFIRYLPSCEDMYAYHRAADVYLSASRSEAFAYGILEAISQDRPVVVSDIKGTSWCHGYSKAVVYRTEDPGDCAEAIRKAFRFRDEKSNAEEITREYSIDKWCGRMLRVYEVLG